MFFNIHLYQSPPMFVLTTKTYIYEKNNALILNGHKSFCGPL